LLSQILAKNLAIYCKTHESKQIFPDLM